MCREAWVGDYLQAHVESMPAVPTYRAGLAHTYCELGRMGEARDQFEVLAETGFELPRDAAWSTGMTLLAETCATLGDADRAQTIYELLLPFADRLAVAIFGQWCGGSMARSLGLLATTMAACDDAEGHFRHTIEVNGRIGARPFLVRTKRAYAEMLVARDGPGDEARALDIAADAMVDADALYMGHEQELLRALVAAVAPRNPGALYDGPTQL